MRRFLFLILVLLMAACSKKPQQMSQKFIEPCEYYMMSYQVKNVSYHDSVKRFLSNDSYITVFGDSIFKVSEELGEFLFNGSKFTYKVIEDSLILKNKAQRLSCKILELAPNSFKLEVDNKYFDRIDMIKPKGKRRKIEGTVKIVY